MAIYFFTQFGLFLFHEWLMHQKAESKKSTSHYRQPLFFGGIWKAPLRRTEKYIIHCLRSYRKPITDQLWSYFSSSLTKKCNFIDVPTRNESLSHVHLYIIGYMWISEYAESCCDKVCHHNMINEIMHTMCPMCHISMWTKTNKQDLDRRPEKESW